MTNEAAVPPPPFRKGLADGFPIFLGYLSVAFTFGMMTTQNHLPVWSAILISMSNFTSSGQFAGTALILSGGSYLEIAVTTFIINVRYILMGISLSQKLDPHITTWQRCLIAFGNSDEIFAVSMQKQGTVSVSYFAGIFLFPYVGWTLGTLIGATAVSLLPLSLRSALGIAIYGMFAAVIIPPARKHLPVAFTVVISAAISCFLRFTPGFNTIGSGWVIIICAIVVPALAAFFFPGKPKQPEESQEGRERADVI